MFLYFWSCCGFEGIKNSSKKINLIEFGLFFVVLCLFILREIKTILTYVQSMEKLWKG